MNYRRISRDEIRVSIYLKDGSEFHRFEPLFAERRIEDEGYGAWQMEGPVDLVWEAPGPMEIGYVGMHVVGWDPLGNGYVPMVKFQNTIGLKVRQKGEKITLMLPAQIITFS